MLKSSGVETESCLVPGTMRLKQFDNIGGNGFSQFFRSKPTEGPASHRGWFPEKPGLTGAKKTLLWQNQELIFECYVRKITRRLFFQNQTFLKLLTCWEETLEFKKILTPNVGSWVQGTARIRRMVCWICPRRLLLDQITQFGVLCFHCILIFHDVVSLLT